VVIAVKAGLILVILLLHPGLPGTPFLSPLERIFPAPPAPTVITYDVPPTKLVEPDNSPPAPPPPPIRIPPAPPPATARYCIPYIAGDEIVDGAVNTPLAVYVSTVIPGAAGGVLTVTLGLAG
jgi:hypothetical protein